MFETSVIIPTFNRRGFLAEAIRSVREQTCCDYELIVVDDGSDDGTAQFVRNLTPDIQLICQENRGPSAARNTGIQAARGEFITFLDSDDRWMPGKLEAQINLMHSQSDAVVCYTDEIWIRNGRRVNQKRHHRKMSGWIFEYSVPLCIVSPSSVLMRRAFFESVGYFDENLPSCEDYDLWLRAALRVPFHFISEKLIVKYGGHEDQLSKQWGLDRYRIEAILKLLDSFAGLDSTQEELLRNTARKKCDILINGFRKRNKIADMEQFTEIRRQLS